MAMTYSEVPSGIRFQAGETVSVVSSLDTTVLVWPAPNPETILTGRPAHWLTFHVLVVSWSVVLVWPEQVVQVAAFAVPASPLPVPASPAASAPSSASTVPPAPVAVP